MLQSPGPNGVDHVGGVLEVQLRDCVPDFPIHLLHDMYQTSRWGRGTAVLPSLMGGNC